jgi:hypothetical protein
MTLGLIIFLLWLLFMTKNNILRTAIVLFFLFWQGIPAYKIWQADKVVDGLCAKDGGIKVYETVTLPKERFNQWGQFLVLDRSVMNQNDEYYSVWEKKDVEGNSNYEISALTIYRNHFMIYRKSDHGLMGEGISYSRRGGDYISPSMPSSYSCVDQFNEVELSKQIFKKN